MKNVKSIILFLCAFCCQIYAQSKNEEPIDVFLRMGYLCADVLENARGSHTLESYQDLKAVLDSLKKNRIGGFLPSLVLSEMINNSIYRNDTIMVFRHFVDLRDRGFKQFANDISDPFSYGLGKVRPTSNEWVSESKISIGLYRNHALNLLSIYPNNISTQYAYNSLLQTKGFQLMADNTFKFLADETGNEQIRTLYRELLRLQNYYNELENKWWESLGSWELSSDYASEKEQISDSISKKKNSIFEIANNDRSYITKFFSSWVTIKNQLSISDIAIEFGKMIHHSGKIEYFALVVDNINESPTYITLCDEQELENVDARTNEGLCKLYDLIWKPINKYFGDKQVVYFTPEGLLYRLPIEHALKTQKGVRLSSTRELIKPKLRNHKSHAILYGGIEYNAEGVSFERCPNYYDSKMTKSCLTPDIIRTRKEYGFLDGTLTEVLYINSLCDEYLVPSTIYMGVEGTETSFKRLSGKPVSSLHISTHGFYWSEDEIATRHDLQQLSFLQLNDSSLRTEDKAMFHSGLLFAGANAILKGDSIPDGYDDGILTAEEISKLDFSGLDILVLSACQTGLGKVTSEGVFGLQRGFKKAGAQTILMSLWEIPDTETSKLMRYFYENWLSGMEKHTAFTEAQRKIKESNPSPYYWAGFIMLD